MFSWTIHNRPSHVCWSWFAQVDNQTCLYCFSRCLHMHVQLVLLLLPLSRFCFCCCCWFYFHSFVNELIVTVFGNSSADVTHARTHILMHVCKCSFVKHTGFSFVRMYMNRRTLTYTYTNIYLLHYVYIYIFAHVWVCVHVTELNDSHKPTR